MLTFRFQTDRFAAWLRSAGGIKLFDLMRIGGAAAADFLRQRFFELDRTRANKMGGRRTHFYSDAARSVQRIPTISNGQATININHLGLAQRYLGGTIRAGAGTSSKSGGPTKFLAIPAQAESYGKTPGEYRDQLSFIPTRRGGMLVQNFQTRLSRGKKGFRSRGEVGGLVLFWLVREVTQKPDPSVLPTEQELENTIGVAITDYLRVKMQPQG